MEKYSAYSGDIIRLEHALVAIILMLVVLVALIGMLTGALPNFLGFIGDVATRR